MVVRDHPVGWREDKVEYESWDGVTMVDRTSMVVTSHITRQLTSRRCRFNREAEIANRRQVWSCRGGQRGRCRGRAAGLSSCQGAFVAASRPRRRV
eukprot:scaffold3143_cov155-Alexandrium_tamarense.AAC.2